MRRLLLSCIIIIATSCHPKPYSYQAPAEKTSIDSAASAQLIFLTFKISGDSTGAKKIELLSSSRVKGDMPFTSFPAMQNFVTVSLLDKGKKNLGSVRHEHPLLREVEYVGDDKSLVRKTVSLKEAEFFVRMASNPSSTYIRIEEMVNGKERVIADLIFNQP